MTTTAENFHTGLQLGAMVQVASLDGSLKYVTRLVGCDGHNVLITALPSPRQMHHEHAIYDDLFHAGRELVMRMILDGVAYGFQSQVIGVSYHGGKLLISSYPSQVQSRPLRSENRYLCTLPAALLLNGYRHEGVITNISRGGCKLHIATDEDRERLLAAKKDSSPCELDVQLPFSDAPQHLTCSVKSVTVGENKHLWLGMHFEGEHQSVAHYLESLHLDGIELGEAG